MPYLIQGRDAICTVCGQRIPDRHPAKSLHDQGHADERHRRTT